MANRSYARNVWVSYCQRTACAGSSARLGRRCGGTSLILRTIQRKRVSSLLSTGKTLFDIGPAPARERPDVRVQSWNDTDARCLRCVRRVTGELACFHKNMGVRSSLVNNPMYFHIGDASRTSDDVPIKSHSSKRNRNRREPAADLDHVIMSNEVSRDHARIRVE
jgi:hypothetical protein